MNHEKIPVIGWPAAMGRGRLRLSRTSVDGSMLRGLMLDGIHQMEGTMAVAGRIA
jgi:hypothetical protein